MQCLSPYKRQQLVQCLFRLTQAELPKREMGSLPCRTYRTNGCKLPFCLEIDAPIHSQQEATIAMLSNLLAVGYTRIHSDFPEAEHVLQISISYCRQDDTTVISE